MGRVKSAWSVEIENLEDSSWEDLVYEIRSMTQELKEDNDRAEEKDNERARQCFSVWEI